jgi:asparagine synthase (glutamine-hydrolysing)
MCGFCGFWTADDPGHRSGWHGADVVRSMSAALGHRGPDSDGVWTDDGHGLALGHRRLAIVDLSPLGHQPMLSPSGRYVIVFNGEIYNFRALRQELAGRFHFQGGSDTEVILAAVEAYGLEAAVRRFIGMFAFALWDRESGRLHLVRDRLGKKPVYYGTVGETFFFSSELHALRAHPAFTPEIDRSSIALLLRYNCIPAPHSIYKGISKLAPGSILTLMHPLEAQATPRPYWSAAEVAAEGLRNPFTGTPEAAGDELEALVRDAVGLRMVADVPLGAFLSGGVDSSLVVAMMQAQSGRPVRTFSIGSPDREYDEAQHAAAVARHLGTDHTELYVTHADALDVVPKLAQIYDEPFADSSQVPTYLVSQLARREVTVALSGDGGDELFAGYNRHVWGSRVWRGMRLVPGFLRRGLAAAVNAMPAAALDRAYRTAEPVIPAGLRQQMFGYKAHKLAGLMAAGSPRDLYSRLASHWLDPHSIVAGAGEPDYSPPMGSGAESWTFATQMMYWDMVTYLPDDILTKVDRASMAVSLEARVPLLDHRLVEFAWRLPLDLKIRDGQSKWLLRQVLYRHVPAALVERPKSGFGIPLDAWLRGPLRDWAEDLLDERRLREEGFFNPAPIRRTWLQHLSGRSSWQYHLWDVLMFQAWYEAQHRRAPVLSAVSAGS